MTKVSKFTRAYSRGKSKSWRIVTVLRKMAFPQSHQQELIELAEITGISAIPGVFRIMLELLALQVSPEDIYTLLKQISTKSRLSNQQTNEGAKACSSTKK